MSLTAKHIIFTGRVQGVGFRFTAHSIANHCSVAGWVRNLPDNTVEMVAQGRPEDIDKCIQSLKDTYLHGVIDTKIEDIQLDPELKHFRITF